MSAHQPQSPLLRIPSKATEEVDLASVVSQLIKNSYGEDPRNYAEQLGALNRARQDAVRGAGSDATARDLLYKWFHMLEMLELRFPELRVPFPWKDAFTGRPISQHSLAYEKASIIFNIASVLSSLGARTSRLSSGNVTSTSSNTSVSAATVAGGASGTKVSYTSLRQSAGMLSYINENFLHAPSTDMSKDVVRWLVDVQLAQATEVFWEKTLEEKKGGSLVARLACQASILYGSLAEEVKEWVTKGIFDRSWALMVQTKAKYFSSVAQYHRAQVDSNASSHGVSLVRLTLSESLAKEAQKLCSTFSASLPLSSSSIEGSSTLSPDAGTSLKTIIDNHLAQASEKKQSAIKDNDLIYHDILPTESTLAPIEPLPAATPVTIQDIYGSAEVQKLIGASSSGSPSNDLFSNLVPLGVHEAASMYSEEKAKLVRGESEKNSLADGELAAALEYMGLPKALNKFKDYDGGSSRFDDLLQPGEEVRSWSEEEIAGGGSLGMDGIGSGGHAVDDALRSLKEKKERAKRDMHEASRILDDESAQCEKLRVRFGDKWSQPPSGTATKSMRADLKSNREALEQAAGNDDSIESLWREEEPMIKVLLGGDERLESAFAEAVSGSEEGSGSSQSKQLLDLTESEDAQDDAQKAQLSETVAAIESDLSSLNKNNRDRSECLTELRASIQSDDISHLLILNRRSPPDAQTQLFHQELDKFQVHTQRIALSIAEQKQLLAHIAQAWKSISASSIGRDMTAQYDKRSKARAALIARLRRAKDAHAHVRAGLGKALAFYGQLEEIASALKRNAKIFGEERKTERERLQQELEWDERGTDQGEGGLEGKLGGMSLGSASYRQPSTGHSSYASPPPPAPPPADPAAGSSAGMHYSVGSSSPYGGPPPPMPPPSSLGGYGSPTTTASRGIPPLQSMNSPYGGLVDAFGESGFNATRSPTVTSPGPDPPVTSPYNTSTSAYSSAPPPRQYTGYGQGPPPPAPPSPYSPYGATSGMISTQYGQAPPPPQRTPSLPPPPPQWSSHSSYGHPAAPPPPPPSQPHLQSQPPPSQLHLQSPYGAPPPPPSYQQGPGRGAPPLPGQHQQQPIHSPYGQSYQPNWQPPY